MEKIKVFIRKNSFLLTVILVVLVAVISVSVSFAFFTKKTDTLENTVTVGEVKIELTESKWDANKAVAIVPNTVLEKNPTIKNSGKNSAYVYISVRVPKANVIVVNNDETLANKTVTDLFTYDVDSNWTLLKSDTSNSDYNLYVYGYTKGALDANNTTETLFNSIKYKNVLEGQIDSSTELDVLVTGMAIQSDTIKLEGTTINDKMLYGYNTYLVEE